MQLDNIDKSQIDLRNKLVGRIDEVQDDVKKLKQLVDTNLADMANKLLAKSTKDRSHISW